jgi:glucose-1-phosphate adenylyltransferase
MGKREVALILAGGRGKRMDILGDLRPKPALPFAGRFRVIDFSTSNCIHSRIADVGVLVDYQREHMAEYLASWHAVNGGKTDFRILPPKIGSYAGTADAVYQNLDYLEKHDSDAVLVLAGDHIYSMDYRKMIDFHRRMKADTTVGVARVPINETHRFGTVTVDAAGRITEFREKSSLAQSNLASMGIYIFDKDRLARRLREDAGEAESLHDFGYNILPRMVKTDKVFAYEFKGYWHDIGTVKAYYEANMALLAPRPGISLDSNWPILGVDNSLPIHAAGRGNNIVNSIISPGCVIQGRVENSVLSPGVHVAEQALVRNSLIMADTSIGYHSIVDGCILDEAVYIGKYCYVGFGAGLLPYNEEITVLGREVTVPDRTAIGRQCIVRPGTGPAAFDTRLIPSGTNLVRS